MLFLRSTISNVAITASNNLMPFVAFNNNTAVVSSTQQIVSNAFAPASVFNSSPLTKRKEHKVVDYGEESGVNNYLMQFQMVAKYIGWSEEECAVNLSANLKGPARSILPTDPNDPVPSYGELCERLRESFDPLRQASYHRAEISAITRKPKETVRALVEQLRPVGVLAYPHMSDRAERENILVDPFIDALTDAEQR